MQKDKHWDWLPVQQHAFETLKSRLLQTHVLIHPDHTETYMLHTDASYVGVGTTLSQLDTEGLPRLVACQSRKWKKAQLNYSVHEKEILSLVDALENWRHYLSGSEIHIFTDKSAQQVHPKTGRAILAPNSLARETSSVFSSEDRPHWQDQYGGTCPVP